MVRVPGATEKLLTHAVARSPGRALGVLVDRPQVGLEVRPAPCGYSNGNCSAYSSMKKSNGLITFMSATRPTVIVRLRARFGEDQPGEEVAERVLLPVDEVVAGLDLQRVRLDRGPRVRRRAQPDDVRIHLHQPVERVAGAMLQRHLDTHQLIPSQRDAARIARSAHHVPVPAVGDAPRTHSTSVPASTIPARLMASWAADSAAISQSPTVAATTANPAAGTVVTEMKTPTSAADFADTNDSIPAAPANSATMNDSGPTWKMKSTSFSSRVLARLDPADGLTGEHADRGDKHGHREADHQRQRGTAGQIRLAPDQRHRERGQRPELGPDHHRADHRDG